MTYFAAHHLGTAMQRDGHRQPQSARLQRPQDGRRRRHAVRRRDPGAARRASKPAPFAHGAGTYRDARHRRRLPRPHRRRRAARAADDASPSTAATASPARSRPALFRRLGCDVTELFCEVDGTFPNHHPDPSKPENLADLIARAARGRAELGLRLRRRRRPPRRGHQGRPHHLSRPAADAVRRRRARRASRARRSSTTSSRRAT